jgi:hypothetical protein
MPVFLIKLKGANLSVRDRMSVDRDTGYILLNIYCDYNCLMDEIN